MRFMPLVLLLGACGGSVCDRAFDIVEDCRPDEPVSEPDSCTSGTRPECEATCAVDAFDARGCDGLFEATVRGDYLGCLETCLDLPETQ